MSLELAWVERDLRAVDRVSAEAFVGSVFEDERPPTGAAGLLDFRLCGRLSRLCRRAFVTGARGELVLMPGRPRVPFDKVLVAGLGARASFDGDAYRDVLEKILVALSGLQVRRVLLELPGRQCGQVSPDVAFQVLRELLGTSSTSPSGGDAPPRFDLEAITVVDDGDAQRVYAGELSRASPRRRAP